MNIENNILQKKAKIVHQKEMPRQKKGVLLKGRDGKRKVQKESL